MESSYDGGVDDRDNISYSDFKDQTNLVRKELINLFPNLTHIVFECTSYNGTSSYQLSLFRLSALIMYSSLC